MALFWVHWSSEEIELTATDMVIIEYIFFLGLRTAISHLVQLGRPALGRVQFARQSIDRLLLLLIHAVDHRIQPEHITHLYAHVIHGSITTITCPHKRIAIIRKYAYADSYACAPYPRITVPFVCGILRALHSAHALHHGDDES